MLNVDKNSDKITFYVAIILCSLIPFVTYPKYVPDDDLIDLFTYYKSIIIYLLGVLSLIVLLIHSVDAKSILQVKFGINISLTLFMAWAVISTFFSSYQKTAVLGIHLQHLGLFTFLCFFIFYTLIKNNFKCEFFKTYINIILISSSIMSLLCFTQFLDISIINYIFSETFNFSTDVYATFGNSNLVGSYF
jgi:hypothetical protein